jgi:hypothetical protein
MTPCQVDHVFVGCGDTASAVNHYDRHVCLIERPHRLFDHELIDAFLAACNAAGIDHDVGNRSEFPEAVLAIAREARIVCNNRVARAGQPVK